MLRKDPRAAMEQGGWLDIRLETIFWESRSAMRVC
jgi:hypothetical protein